MILSFKHKGLEQFFIHRDTSKITYHHAEKLERILDRLNASLSPRDMNLPGYKLHKLTGRLKDSWAVSVSGNWRVTFSFNGPDVVNVDYLDYH